MSHFLDRLTFFVGSGLAGVAGVAASLIGGTNSQMGAQYIIPAFLVVADGGVDGAADRPLRPDDMLNRCEVFACKPAMCHDYDADHALQSRSGRLRVRSPAFKFPMTY